jgi:DNA repair protein RadD
MIKDRDYQINAIQGVRNAIFNGSKRVLVQASTGAGKTHIAARIIESAVNKGKRVLFVAHRKEIIGQSSLKLDSMDIDHGIIMADHPRYKPTELVQVASVQTLRVRHKPKADIVFFDEAHLSVSKSFLDLVEHYKESIIIGLTATPVRTDGRGLGEIYQHMTQVVPMRELIEQGFLVQPRVFAPFIPNLGNFKVVRGDYDATQVAAEMDKSSITGDIVKHWKQHAQGRSTICFASSVAHSEHIADEFNANGITAKHLDAKTPAHLRDKIIHDFKIGKFKVLSNMGILIEGFDYPETSCVILARPTQSVTIYLQAVGRGMRTACGKDDVIILDHAGLTHSHGFVTDDREWSLDGRKKKSRKNAEDKALSVHICVKCFCAYSKQEHPDACPECGKETEKRAIIEVDTDAELVEISPLEIKAQKRMELVQARTIEELVALGRARNYQYPVQWAQRIIEQRNAWQNKKRGVML